MAEEEHSAILLTFIKLPFVIKIFILSIFEWPFYTGFTVGALTNDVDQDDMAQILLYQLLGVTITPSTYRVILFRSDQFSIATLWCAINSKDPAPRT